MGGAATGEKILSRSSASSCYPVWVGGSQEGGKARLAVAYHAGATLCCAAACLSNAVAAVIPLLVTAWDVFHLTRPKLWRILRGTAALWIIGAATIAIKQAGECAEVGGQPEILFAHRLMLVFNVYWLNQLYVPQ